MQISEKDVVGVGKSIELAINQIKTCESSK